MTDKPRHTTDAAQEFGSLMQRILDHRPNDGGQMHEIFMTMIIGKQVSNPVMLAYSAINRRADDLLRLVEECDDSYLTEKVRAQGVTAIKAMRDVCAARHFMSSWAAVVKSCLTPQNVVALVYLSPMLSKHYPLPAIEPDEIETVSTKLREASEELSAGDGLPDWAKAPLRAGVRDLLFVLDNFVIFGHDEAVSRLVSLIGTVSAVAQQAKAPGTEVGGLNKLLVSLVLAVDLFCAGPNVAQSSLTYYGWMTGALETVRPLISPPLRQIEGPKPPPTEAA